MWLNYRDEHEPLSWLKEDLKGELEEMISTDLFKVIITDPKDVEFKLRPWYSWVSVFIKWEFQCYLTKQQWKYFADDTSKATSVIDDYYAKLEEYESRDISPTPSVDDDIDRPHRSREDMIDDTLNAEFDR